MSSIDNSEPDLDLSNYDLQDILNLFQIPENFTEADLKKAKRQVLKLHPDKSRIDSKYFLFYSKVDFCTYIFRHTGIGIGIPCLEFLLTNQHFLILIEYLKPMIDYGIDQLVLGCTNYFIIQDLIKKIIGNNIIINNYNVAVASQVKRILLKEKIVNSEKNEIYNDFYSNGNKFALEKLLGKKNSVIKI